MSESSLWLAIALSVIFTIALKTAPITLLKGDSLPCLLRKWLEFVPVAVMAALVGPDVFFYGGEFNFSLSNLFLPVSFLTLLVAILSKNFFVTIAAGIGMVIAARYFGFC